MSDPLSGPGESAALALLAIAAHHGLHLSRRELRALRADGSLELDTLGVLHLASALGLEAAALEGELHQLPEVPRPNIVILRGEGGALEYATLLEIDEASSVVGEGSHGATRRLTADELRRRWTGDAIQLLPHPTDFARRRSELESRRRPRARLLRALGVAPRSLSRLLFWAALAAVATALALAGATATPLLPIGLALHLSLASQAAPPACSACARAGSLVGRLPLAWLGAAYYGALFTAGLVAPGSTLLAPAAAFAVGCHLFLLGLLWRERLPCVLCLGVALSAVLAAIWLAPGPHPAVFAAAVAGGIAVGGVSVALFRRLWRLENRAALATLAGRIASTPPPPAPQFLLVVYTREGCPSCHFYKSVVAPALSEEFGERLLIEERTAGTLPIAVPFFAVVGPSPILLGNLSSEEAHDVLRTALCWAAEPTAAPPPQPLRAFTSDDGQKELQAQALQRGPRD